jgi:hypothetical protein
MRLVHQPIQTAGAIEQGILGVQMQMDKLGVRHGDNLTFHRQDTKTQSFEKLTKMTAAALTHAWQKMFHVLPQPGLLPKEKENHPPSL